MSKPSESDIVVGKKKKLSKQKSTSQLLDLAKGFVVNINVNVNK